MSYATIEVNPVSPHIGAEIAGIDLSAPLGNRQVEDLHEALDEHLVLFFRNQALDYDSAKRLGRYFGELAIHPNTPGPEGHPEILPIHADANSKLINGERWHSDVSCNAEPSYASILHLTTVPTLGGDTLFASQYAAYDALSPRLKVYLEGLTAVHDGGPSYRSSNARRGIPETGKVYPSAVHPVIVRHPVTGKKAIYVNVDFTARINDLAPLESERVLRFLVDHCANAQWTVRFRWQPHSIAFWDNRCVQHQAIWDYWPNVRSGFRVQIEGTVAPVAG